MSETGFFSGLSVVVPVKSNESVEWLTELVSIARLECSEIVLVLESDADVTEVRPALGSFGERCRLLYQSGKGKADALNTGLRESKNAITIFLDSDVVLEPGQLSTVRAMFDDPDVSFVGVPYGKVSFPILSQTSGWFFAARRGTFISLGGWEPNFVEDVATGRKLLRAGYRIYTAPFSVQLRRGVRRPLTKLFSAMFAGR